MSGLEALGLAANLMQVIGFAGEVIERVHYFQGKYEGRINILEQLNTKLPALETTLGMIVPYLKSDQVDLKARASLKPLADGCKQQIRLLNVSLEKIQIKEDDNRLKFAYKAVKSVFKDRKLEELTATLCGYVDSLQSFHTIHITTNMSAQLKACDVSHIDDAIKDLIEQSNDSDVVINQRLQALAVLTERIDGRFEAFENQQLRMTEEQKVTTKFNNIPLDRKVSEYVPRLEISKKIEKLLSPGTSSRNIVVLKGMGGQGKTQLAIDFCERANRSGRFETVIWGDASSETTLLRSFEEISSRMTKRNFGNVQERVDFVKEELNELQHSWLFVLDNYDSPQVFDSAKLQTFLPSGKSGHFLVTSRHPGSSRLCRAESFIEILGLKEQEAVELLLRRPGLERQRNEAEAKAIVKRLGYHALAIDLLAAYVQDRGYPDLRNVLDKFNREKNKILGSQDSLPHVWEYRHRDEKDKDIALTVFATWELSYEQLGDRYVKRHVKDKLLAQLAFLQNSEISERVFKLRDKTNSSDAYPEWLRNFIDDDDETWDHEKFLDVLCELKKLSLISSFTTQGDEENELAENITLHPLVNDWIKLRLPKEKRSQAAVEAAQFVNAYLMFDQNDAGSFDMSLERKHEATAYVDKTTENLRVFRSAKSPCKLGEADLASTGETFALFNHFMGKTDDAYNLFKATIGWREQHLPEKHEDLLRIRSLSTEVLRSRKNFKEAETIDRFVYEARLESLGQDHRDTLWSAHDLGWDLEALGDVEQAEYYQKIAYYGRKDSLGPNHELTLQSSNNYAHLLRRTGRTIDALELMHETRMLAEVRYSRPHHPEVLCFLQNELDCLRYNSQLDQALELAYKSFEGTCREWGEGHPKASNAAGQLKDCLWDLGMQDEAEKVARNNLIIMQDSPHSTDSSMVNDIAMLLDVLSGRQMSDGTDTGIDRKEDMRGLVVAALQLVKKIPPETLKLPSTLQDLIYLSSGLEIMKFYPELESLERKIYDNCEVVYGLSDRNTINSLVRLSSSVRNQNRSKEADYICHDAIEKLKEEVEKQKVGVKSAHLAALSWLAVLHKHVGEHSAAKEVYEKAYNYVIVGDYIDTADYETLYSIQGLAEDIDDQKDFERAQVLHVRVLRARESKFKDGHPCLDDSLYAYSWNLRLQKRLPMALKYCKKAYEIAVKFRGNHRNTFCILKRLAYLKEQLGMTAEAEAHYREVLESFRNLGSRHMTRVTEAIEDLQELLMEQQKWEDAKPLIEEAMERRRRGWDKNPGHYAGLMRHLAIVTWNLGDGETGLKLYREARVAYENAWGVRDPDLDPVKMQKLIERINELLPGTETMAEEERRQEVQAEKQLKLDEAAAEARAREINKDRRKAEEETASAKAKEVARTQQKVEAKLEHYNEQAAGNAQPVSHVQYDGKTQSYQMSVKQNEEAVVGNESLSRSTTLAMDADEQNHMTVGNFPEAPKHEPSRFAEDLSSQMGRLQVREPAT